MNPPLVTRSAVRSVGNARLPSEQPKVSGMPTVGGPAGQAAEEAAVEAAAPQLEIDELLTQLVARAHDVMATQSRLRTLLEANASISGHMPLPETLRRIAEAACRLGGAECAAIRAAQPGTEPMEIVVGPDDADAAGERLEVPISVAGKDFGALVVTRPRAGAFSSDDCELLRALATTGGIAIENGQLYEQERRRREWLQASMELTRCVLADEGEEPLAAIARVIREVADADYALVVLPTPNGADLMVEVADGESADELAGLSFPTSGSPCAQAMHTGLPQAMADVAERAGVPLVEALADFCRIGPLLALPLSGDSGAHGVVVLVRRHGRQPFEVGEIEQATSCANNVGVALDLAEARTDQQRVAVLEDRHRIAADLHDHVLQRLFANGMSMQAIAGTVDPQAAARLDTLIDDTDDTIAQIRAVIHGLGDAKNPTGPPRLL